MTFVLFPGDSLINCQAISLASSEFSTSSGIKHSQSLLAEWAYNAAGVACVTLVVVTNPMIIVNVLSHHRLKLKIFHPERERVKCSYT